MRSLIGENFNPFKFKFHFEFYISHVKDFTYRMCNPLSRIYLGVKGGARGGEG